MTFHVANAARLAQEAMAEVLEPPPPIDYLAWASDNIVFSSRESDFKGPYNRELFPEFDEILRALSPDDPCRVVTMACSAQIGKTTLANIFTLGSMAMDPGDFLYTHPTHDNAKRWSQTKLRPMLRNTTALTDIFPEGSRETADSIFYKERADKRGAIQISGANSPASLSMISVSRQVQDDLAKWETNDAGDPEAQADSRSRAKEFAKVLKISTPLIWPGCRITKSFRAGSQERPFVPCPHCGHMQVLEWANMLATIEQNSEDPHFTCVGCGCEIREHDKRWMKARLEWRADNPKALAYHRSFWTWTAYSVLQSWVRLAQEWLQVKGDPAGEQSFLNNSCGLAFETTGEMISWEILRDRASESHYARGEVPAGALMLTLGIDCQGDRVEWQLVGWGRDRRRWVVQYGVIPGHITDAGCQGALDLLLKETWRNSYGRRLAADAVAIDGNAWTEDVWTWARRHPQNRVIMVRGVGAETAPLIARVASRDRKKDGKPRKYSRRFFNIAVSVLKMALTRNLPKTDPLERGAITFPRGLDDEYFRQLTAERRKEVKRKDGFAVYQWFKDPNQANEALDTMNQAEAAAIRLGVRDFTEALWDKLETDRECALPAAQGDLEDLMGPRTAFASAPAPAPSAVLPPAAANSAPPSTARARARKLA
ncbi:MAG: phage terminase large subunit family protein [Caulobacteraceae bacterium]|nr:phage terminase large subunit family protein [Caulobacteraceae bacterium]